ncbi:AI-2E family transporter [Paenibacillus agilis]|uniref:AI-2E family transporter n=1 Tax=Paenibacillus agilis TaxID=3020863 RepID=A0A559J3K9_9BACL|nr:AI-2E family transporter [Paenibacillus agilis]TVX94451.1 AI-2E family transporter [Paenibacillus agilis]
MLAFYRKYWKTVFDIALVVLTVYLIMFAFSQLYAIAAPIFLALIIFWIIEPLARKLARRGIPKSIASALSVMLFVLVILGSLIGAGIIFTQQVGDIVSSIPTHQEAIVKQIAGISEFLQDKYKDLPGDVATKMNTYFQDFASKAAKWMTSFLNWLVTHVASFSTFVMNFGIAVVLAYFLSTEIESWRKITQDKTPRTFKKAFVFLKENVFRGIGAYLKAQLKLISITFTLVFISLTLLDVGHAFTIALLSALFDILPLLGVPVIFVPWIIYMFIVGNTTMAIWLTVVLVVTMATRQFLEPKITGNTLGVSAFTMLSFMIVSLSLFGIAGLILAPILLILLKALYDQGYFQRWIRMPVDEFDSNPLVPNVEPSAESSTPSHTNATADEHYKA